MINATEIIALLERGRRELRDSAYHAPKGSAERAQLLGQEQGLTIALAMLAPKIADNRVRVLIAYPDSEMRSMSHPESVRVVTEPVEVINEIHTLYDVEIDGEPQQAPANYQPIFCRYCGDALHGATDDHPDDERLWDSSGDLDCYSHTLGVVNGAQTYGPHEIDDQS